MVGLIIVVIIVVSYYYSSSCSAKREKKFRLRLAPRLTSEAGWVGPECVTPVSAKAETQRGTCALKSR